MKIRILSDLHNEFILSETGTWYAVPPLPDDHVSLLILAGDLAILSNEYTYRNFLDRVAKQFAYVFYIGGNHEWYHGNIDKHEVCKIIEPYDNVFTDRLELTDEKITIIGNTLWTDFDQGSVTCMDACRRGMNDFYYIKRGESYSHFTPYDAYGFHREQKNWIFETVRSVPEDHRVIVVTHHHPSAQGVQESYKGHVLNGAFYSDLEATINQHKIDYWICGHMHTAMRYQIGNTQVICNPVGYPGEVTNYDPLLTIEI